jgi:hypothetical protein
MGMVTVLAGDAKAGKSLVTCKIAATVSRGQQFPFTEGEARRGHVVLINAEDDAARILRPRLEAAGADLQRIHIPAQQSRLTRRLTLDALRQELRNIPHLRAGGAHRTSSDSFQLQDGDHCRRPSQQEQSRRCKKSHIRVIRMAGCVPSCIFGDQRPDGASSFSSAREQPWQTKRARLPDRRGRDPIGTGASRSMAKNDCLNIRGRGFVIGGQGIASAERGCRVPSSDGHAAHAREKGVARRKIG